MSTIDTGWMSYVTNKQLFWGNTTKKNIYKITEINIFIEWKKGKEIKKQNVNPSIPYIRMNVIYAYGKRIAEIGFCWQTKNRRRQRIK